MVTFEFVYILYKIDSFIFLVNWPTIQFLNSCFLKSSHLLCVRRHLWNSKASVSLLLVGWILTIQVVSCSKNIVYRLRSDNFIWYCLFYLPGIINRRHYKFLFTFLSPTDLVYNAQIIIDYTFCTFCEWSLKISAPWSMVERILVIDIYLHDAKAMIVVKGVKILHGMWN